MAKNDKNKNANKETSTTDGTANTDASATATAPKKDRAPAGSSIAAQAKAAILAVRNDLHESIKGFEGITLAELLPTSYQSLESLFEKITETESRGIPLPIKLEQVEKEIGEHYAAAPIVDGKLDSTNVEWGNKLTLLNNKKARIASEIKKLAEAKEAKEKEATENADTKTSGAGESEAAANA